MTISGLAGQTIGQVFQSKGLWAWFSSAVTNPFDGASEKGQDYSTKFGTPVGVPVGGTITRIEHNNNAINDIVEMQDSSGAVWLYQHITATVKVGDVLQCGSVIGTENGLPVDQYSTGPHIEVRYCTPGTWKTSIISWNEPWINPKNIFVALAQQQAGSVASGGGNPFTDIIGNAVASWQTANPIAPDANVAAFLAGLDTALELQNPFNVQNPTQDNISAGPVNFSFTDPVSWAADVGTNMVQDLSALTFRVGFVIMGLIILYVVALAVTKPWRDEALHDMGEVAKVVGPIIGDVAKAAI